MLFDKEYEFKGKHATYCRFLRDEVKLFKTFREIYAASAIIGYLFSSKSKSDSEKVQPASILPSELAQKRSDLTFIYRLIMLLDPVDGFTINDYQNRTFRDDAESEKAPEKIKSNMEIFNSYANGGIEILYDLFKDCKEKKDTVNELYEFLYDFYSENNLLENP